MPQTIFSLPLAGATSPVTIVGTMVQVNAEVLSAIVALQLASPGCPLIYVANAAIMDMHAAKYAQAGPEAWLFNAGLIELGKHYGLPTFTVGFNTDAWQLSMHAGIDALSTALSSFLCHPDVVSGPGTLGSSMLLYLPKLVFDAEMRRMCDRMMRGVAVDEEHIMYNLISLAGPGGHYLGAKETSRCLRAGEHLVPEVLLRSTADTSSVVGGRSSFEPGRSSRKYLTLTHLCRCLVRRQSTRSWRPQTANCRNSETPMSRVTSETAMPHRLVRRPLGPRS